MIKKSILAVILLPLCILPVWGRTATGDTIYFKDGTREESDRVWESDAYIHFILKGTKTVEVRFAKEFVDHIVRTSGKKMTRLGSGNAKQQSASPPPHDPNVSDQALGKPVDDKKNRSELLFDEKVVKDNRGIRFYDPHRPQRYWADKYAKYKTLDEALSTLAQTYGRSVEWVRQNMGEENDLGAIHFNLMRHLDRQEQSQGNRTQELHQAAPKKKTSSPPTSGGYIKPEKSYQPSMQVPAGDTAPTGHASPKNPLFYDPRREKKYWISTSERYDTLNEALTALAQMYKVSVGWIEEHLGNSNSIAGIHETIRRNLSIGADVNQR